MMREENVSLKQFNTFGIDVTASTLLRVNSVDTLIDLQPMFNQHPVLILGGGSNILFRNNVDAVVVHNEIKGITILEESIESVVVEFGSGEVWHECVRWAVKHNYGGIENLALIPGTIGAAPIQNIGAYGVEIESCIVAVKYMDITNGNLCTLLGTECRFGYRDSIFKHELKGQFFITSVQLRLQKNPIAKASYKDVEQELNKNSIVAPTILDIYNAVVAIRTRKLPNPAEIGNAGSFFKNPIVPLEIFTGLLHEYPNIPSYPATESSKKIPAAWLIEQSGYKGYRINNTGTHTTQPLVLVNYGGATGKEILELAYEIQSAVYRKFAVTLEMEVNIFPQIVSSF